LNASNSLPFSYYTLSHFYIPPHSHTHTTSASTSSQELPGILQQILPGILREVLPGILQEVLPNGQIILNRVTTSNFMYMINLFKPSSWKMVIPSQTFDV